MNTAIWIFQALLFLVFTLLGIMRLYLPVIKLEDKMPLVKGLSVMQVKLIGIAQLSGAIAVIFPSIILYRWSLFTPIAAIGLALLIIVAAIDHINKKEFKPLFPLAIFFLIAVFIVYQFVLHYQEVSYGIYQYGR